MSLRLLIADDDRDMAQSLAMLLRQQGFEVQMAFNGQEAIEAAESFLPDVFIVDLGMPILDGLQVVNHLRALPQFAGKVFVALTGYSDQSHLDRASQAQFDEYLIKPFKFDTLLDILREAASRSAR